MSGIELLEERERFVSEVQRYGHQLIDERRPTLAEQVTSGVLARFAETRPVWWQHEHRHAGATWFAEVRVYSPSPSGVASVVIVKNPAVTFTTEGEARACQAAMVREYIGGELRLTNGTVTGLRA